MPSSLLNLFRNKVLYPQDISFIETEGKRFRLIQL